MTQHHADPTVYAAAMTPLEPAGLAVVSLVGPHATEILRSIFRPRIPISDAAWPSTRLRFGQLLDGDSVLDDTVVARADGPDGTVRIDFNVHGGPRIVQRLLLSLQRQGARIVPAAELSAATWHPRHMIDAEVHERLPSAQTRRVAAWLLRQRELLPDLLMTIRDRLGDRGSAPVRLVRQLCDTFTTASRVLGGVTVAIVGPPNAGKSTLANCLCGTRRVLVSDTPGTTRDHVTHETAIHGIPVRLVDTAGLRPSAHPIEAEAIARSRRQSQEADVRLVVLDASAEPSEDAWAVLREFHPGAPSLLVLNKQDLGSRLSVAQLPPAWRPAAVPVSGARGTGIDVLCARILQTVGITDDFTYRAALFTERQRRLLADAVSDDASAVERLAKAIDDVIGRRDVRHRRA